MKIMTGLNMPSIDLGPGKNFGSGQLIFENWSGGLVDLFSFFEPQHKSSKSYFLTSLKT